MTQLILPFVEKGTTQISDLVTVQCGDKYWTYFLGTHPIYIHLANDQRSFRLTTSQLIQSGGCRVRDIINTFEVSKSSVLRALKKYREHGAESFFKRRRGRRGGYVLTKDVLGKAQDLLNNGYSKRDAAEELDVKYDTLRKAISDGRLRGPKSNEPAVLSKSSRSLIDTAAAEGMGTACTRVVERVLASSGKCVGATVQFETCLDVPRGGVLCALPLLLANGLLHGAERFLGKTNGYYTMFHILLLLAFMALCRIKTVQRLQGYAPGEFGKLLELDRIPDISCLRRKLDHLSAGETAQQWATHLSSYWMNAEPEAVGTLYIDGHVSVYHGSRAKLPRRYVSRQRLCLRGTTDYWVNDAIGRPFFVVEKVVDPGLLKTLREDIIPRLLIDVPGQPTNSELEDAPFLCRFILVFDREGYSPAFFAEMWRKHRIACISYHKHPGEDWPEEWFTEHKVAMPRGEVVEMRLCEMGGLVGSGKNGVWMREVRKLKDSGHQTSVISTAFDIAYTQVAARMFTRWCQENFFRYMMQHFDIDQINTYGIEELPDTEKVVNPEWRELNRERYSVLSKLRYRRARFGQIIIHPAAEDEPAKYEKWLKKKGELLEDIDSFEHQADQLKEKLKTTDKHITWVELNEKDRFYRLPTGRMCLMETVKMICYRAETAMVGLLIGPTVDSAAARRLLQDLFISEADIIPDTGNNQLTIRVHSASRPSANRSLVKIFNSLNEAELKYPGTDMRLIYELLGTDRGGGGATFAPV